MAIRGDVIQGSRGSGEVLVVEKRFGWFSWSFRHRLWYTVKAVRDKEQWLSRCGSAQHYRRVLEGYRKTLLTELQERGKEALNKRVQFFGVSIAECDEMLGHCARMRLLGIVQCNGVAQRSENRSKEIGRLKKSMDYRERNERAVAGTRNRMPAAVSLGG